MMKKEIKNKNQYSNMFIILLAISVATILISNITSVKLFKIFNFNLPSSGLLFPISYILGDVFTEVYGFKKARMVIIIGFLCNAFMVLFFKVSIMLPSASCWTLQDAYKSVLEVTPRMFTASLLAYLIGSLTNAYVMVKIKKLTKEKYLWVRTIGSTIIGEFLDSLIFCGLAFYKILGIKVLITTILVQFLWKVIYETIATPLTYLVVRKIKEYEKI